MLEPVRHELPGNDFRRLVHAIVMTIWIEAIIVLAGRGQDPSKFSAGRTLLPSALAVRPQKPDDDDTAASQRRVQPPARSRT